MICVSSLFAPGFAFSDDIENAILNIYLHPDDRDYTQFFGYQPSSQFNFYFFKVIFFRAASSP